MLRTVAVKLIESGIKWREALFLPKSGNFGCSRQSDLKALLYSVDRRLSQNSQRLLAINEAVQADRLTDCKMEQVLLGELPIETLNELSTPIPILDSAFLDYGKENCARNSLDMLGYELPNETLHRLTPLDYTAAISAGMIGSLIVSIPVGKQHTTVTNLLHRHQNTDIKGMIESIFGESSSKAIDSIPGRLHRFAKGDHSHDLLSGLFSALSKNKNIQEPFKKLLSHLLVDSCGATGVPFLGSTYISDFLSFLFQPINYEKWHSRFAAYRHSDSIASGATSLLITLYQLAAEVPSESLRKPKIGAIAHSVAASSTLLIANVNPVFAARRSLVNNVSLSLSIKNMIQLLMGARRLSVDTKKQKAEAHSILDQVEKNLGGIAL